MIALDTNLLVYAHRRESPWHSDADLLIEGLAESGRPWSIPWPCIQEFIAIATHPRIFDPPTPVADAMEQVTCWLEVPSMTPLAEGPGYWKALREVLAGGHIRGQRIHDARIIAVCMRHGVKELWTADRDFSRMPQAGLAVKNPLVDGRS